MKGQNIFTAIILTFFMTGCATESHRAVEIQKVATYNTAYTGKRSTLVVGGFSNKSNYMQGLFSSNIDRLGNQAKTILKTHLQQSNRFNLMDRDNMEELKREAELSGVTQKITGSRYVLTGHVTEFGRKVTGDRQLFGILGRGKEQIAYAKITLQVIDTHTSAIIYSTQGAGEYSLSNREVIGFGGTAGYDATLNGKVLNFAITEAVNAFVRDLDANVIEL
ncbi:CsgG/HfaB family protein [Litoribrevibacter euphylliae]|uniref:Curli production assembly/transport component CsgG n=1 Tax=Litoribrevibacter euphylliae TaxID=1834034 RepID=A0ABV7HGW5_9GAMM